MSNLRSMLITIFFSTFVCLAPAVGSAQTSPTSTDPSIPPAVAAELDAMRHRIEQLEQELRQNKLDSTQPSAALSSGTPDISPSVQNLVANSAPTTQPSSPDKPKKEEPFSYADWTWLNGNPRTKTVPMDTKFFTPEIRADTSYIYDFNHPQDDTIGGSSEVFRANEFQVTQLGVGGDFHFDNVRARLMTQFGMYSDDHAAQ